MYLIIKLMTAKDMIMKKCTCCDGYGNVLDEWDRKLQALPEGNIWAIRKLEDEMIAAGIDPTKYLKHGARSWTPPELGPVLYPCFLPFGPNHNGD